MKKLLAMALTLALALGCTCALAEETTYTVGICQLVQHDALDAATQGFKDALTEALGDRVTFDEQNASGDSTTCATIVNSFVSKGVDLIMANATAAVQAAATATYDIPILGTSVTEYGVALDIPDFDGVTGYNVSGTSDLAPLDQQAAMLMELFPEAETVGMLYCSAEPNSVYQVQVVTETLEAAGIAVQTVPWYADAVILTDAREDAVTALPLYERGAVYMQSLSSMLPALFLGAQAGENVLDMAAAPGGKTTQIAALTGNGAMITACEKNKIRAERLKYNVERQGASHVTVMTADAGQLDDLFKFDRILLDAPCSGSGTVQLGNPKSKGNFNDANLAKTTKAQAALLNKALKLLRPGHEMIYSTCSILERENEAIVRRAMSWGAEVVPLELTGFEDVPALPTKIPGTLCVMPTQLYEGFFVAKLRRKK